MRPIDMRRGSPAFLVALTVFLVVASVASTCASAGTFRIGYADPDLKSKIASVRDLASNRAIKSGASITRINVAWAEIAPAKPDADFDATDPDSPGYRWENLDAAIETAAEHHLEVVLSVQRAPLWAEGPGRPRNAKVGIYEILPGAWKPDPIAYGEFAQALAERYSGSFPDPLQRGSNLPRVRYFDAWNEPNLVDYLAPQVEGGKQVGALIYRKLLNSFYAGVKQSQPNALVLGASFAPFGRTDGSITAPVLFLRSLLCLRGNRLVPSSCPEKAHLDAVSAHPIEVGPPTESAASPLDITTPDLGRAMTVIRAAERAGTVVSNGRIGLWVTEFWVDSKPPDPNGIPVAEQARWYEQAMYEYWKAGAKVAIELLLRDFSSAPAGDASTLQTGVYYVSGRAKPSQTAMRFPLVGHRAGSKVGVWGIAPAAGTVSIEAQQGGAWKTVAKVHAGGRSRPFTARFGLIGAATLRARIGGEQSLPWTLDQ